MSGQNEGGLDDFEVHRARRAELRTRKPSIMKRYLIVMSAVIVGLFALVVWLKPPLEKMREGVEDGLGEYARLHLKPGETMPAVTHEESHDWLIAVSHSATVGEFEFSCWGVAVVTVCSLPGE